MELLDKLAREMILVNLYEDEASERAVETALERIFRTKTGRELCKAQFWAV